MNAQKRPRTAVKATLWLVQALFALGIWSKVPAQNIVSNGGFEFLAHPSNSIVTLSVGSANLPGWNISGTGSLYQVTTPLSGSTFSAWEGHQFISFNGNQVSLSQTQNVTAGQTYEVGFVVGYFQGVSTMRVIGEAVSTNGDLLGSLDVAAPTSPGWASPSRFRFVATSDQVMLKFRGTNATPNVDLVLDAVSLEPVVRPVSIQAFPIQICWESQTNRSYQIQYKTNLASPDWLDSGSPVAGTGSTICSNQITADPQKFFRVILLP